jgi:hypothetical protein
MRINQSIVIFYILLSVIRILFWVVGMNGCVRSVLLVFAAVLAISLSGASSDGQAVLAPMAASLPAIIAPAVGAFLHRE